MFAPKTMHVKIELFFDGSDSSHRRFVRGLESFQDQMELIDLNDRATRRKHRSLRSSDCPCLRFSKAVEGEIVFHIEERDKCQKLLKKWIQEKKVSVPEFHVTTEAQRVVKERRKRRSSTSSSSSSSSSSESERPSKLSSRERLKCLEVELEALKEEVRFLRSGQAPQIIEVSPDKERKLKEWTEWNAKKGIEIILEDVVPVVITPVTPNETDKRLQDIMSKRSQIYQNYQANTSQ